MINIDEIEIERGWEWFVFKKRSQRARKARMSGSRERTRHSLKQSGE